MSTFSNKRTDEYGGTLANRMRFALEVIAAVREAVGADYPVIFRFNTCDYVEGGIELPEAIVMAKMLEEAGVDALHCTQGMFTSKEAIIAPGFVPVMHYAENAATIKKSVKIPVLAVGRYNDIYMSEAMLRDEEPVFPSDLPVFLKEILGEEPDGVLVERARQIVDDQRNTWKAQSSKLRAELSMLEAQYAQRQSEVAEQLARKKQLDGSLVLETEQRDTAKRLLQRNNYSRMDYLGLEQKIIQTQGEIDMLAAAIPKTQAMMDEARQRIGSRVAEEQLAISQEINKRRTELGSVRESLTAGGDRVTRTEVRSPVRGRVKQKLVNTVGGVVKPGEAIMDIVPMDESLLVEVRVRPQDVAFLRPGQDVMIKVSAYDFSIYGGLPGKLESISADTIEDKKGDFYYLVKVRTGETAIRRNDEILPIIPGMIVVADIIIGKKTVLDYILKPVMKARQNALTER